MNKEVELDESVLKAFCEHTTGISEYLDTSIYTLVVNGFEVVGFPVVKGMEPKENIIFLWELIKDYVEAMKDCSTVKEIEARKLARQLSRKRNKTQEEINKEIASSKFLETYSWRKLRMRALQLYGSKCHCCGATPESGAVINVDHIKPRKYYPELALDINNTQILCHDCNHGKGNWSEYDFRPRQFQENKVNELKVVSSQ